MEQWDGLANGDLRETREDDNAIIYYVSDGVKAGIHFDSPTPSKVLSITVGGKPNMGTFNTDTGWVGFGGIPPAGALIRIVAE